jgi:uroporphyrin-III C-methyltransferase/precorrin-2 dehydrogenase/sirohydrochlorin ferrochelatase
MRYFPLFVDLTDRQVLVVGEGEVAARKAAALAAAGARVEVLAKHPEPVLLEAAQGGSATGDEPGDDRLGPRQPRGAIQIRVREFQGDDVRGRALVVSATGDARRDADVSAAARSQGVPVNVVDRPHLCSFVWPAIVDRDPVTVAVCSAGTAPVLARSIRSHIEAMLPSNLGRLAGFADGFRAAVKATRSDGSARRRFWERFFESPVAATVLAGDERRAREQMLALINRRVEAAEGEGRVTLVGAGPGDPELLTLKAIRALQEADVIVHDRLVGPRILDYARRDAERIDAGKAPGCHPLPQDAINRLLVEHAQAGRRVVRLKGGDPFVFGRGGEERAYLLRHGIRCDVVPGITAATGCAAAAGIPLTRRGAAQTLMVVTARGGDGDESDLEWRPASDRRWRSTWVRLPPAALPGASSMPVATRRRRQRRSRRARCHSSARSWVHSGTCPG